MISFLRSFRFAFQGLRFAWAGRNFRVQCVAAVVVICFGMYFRISTTEWLAVLLISGLVLSFEIVNTSIETFVNLVSPEIHPLAGKVKDLAAAAVLVLSIISVAIGLIVFIPHIL